VLGDLFIFAVFFSINPSAFASFHEMCTDDNIITTVSELEHDEHEGMDELALKEHEEITKIKNISNVVFGRHEIECWYFSPFPKEYHPDGPVDFLYYCEFSMRFFRSKEELLRYFLASNGMCVAMGRFRMLMYFNVIDIKASLVYCDTRLAMKFIVMKMYQCSKLMELWSESIAKI
jgi:hypothetical protein